MGVLKRLWNVTKWLFIIPYAFILVMLLPVVLLAAMISYIIFDNYDFLSDYMWYVSNLVDDDII